MKLTLNTVCRGLAAGALFGVALPVATPAFAQDEEQLVEELVVVGSRRRDRSAADSPVPVDVIGGEDFRNQGDTDMDSLLAALVPSYNVDQQPISDAGTVIRPASLRGLPSDATLVLVNGKRRHRGAVISFLGGGISDGAHGPDLSAIPAVALDRVEVLRDGASAQYGSDAIAGVLNLVLREDSSGGSVEAKWGRSAEGDGEATTLAANLGLPLMDTGFINLSMEYKQADPTSRSVQRADAAGLIAAGNSRVRQPAAQIWGAPEIRDDLKLFANLGFEVGENSELYAYGNWAQRTVEGGFFFRNPHTRGGVFRGPVVDGVPTVKVANLSGEGDCPDHSGHERRCRCVRHCRCRSGSQLLLLHRALPRWLHAAVRRRRGGLELRRGAARPDGERLVLRRERRVGHQHGRALHAQHDQSAVGRPRRGHPHHLLPRHLHRDGSHLRRESLQGARRAWTQRCAGASCARLRVARRNLRARSRRQELVVH